MYIGNAIRVDATKILSRRELAAVLACLERKAPRSARRKPRLTGTAVAGTFTLCYKARSN
jgi:hypothetical protein